MRIKNVIVLTGLAATTASISPCVLAQSRGPFVGASIGQADFRDACAQASTSGTTCDKSDTAFSGFFGFQMDKVAAIEAGYTDLGKATSTGTGGTTSTVAKGFELTGVGSVPLSTRFSLFVKAGVFRWDLDQKTSAPGSNLSQTKTGTDLTYGFGMRLNFTNTFALRAQYQRYKDIGDDAISSKTDIDVISVGAIFSF